MLRKNCIRAAARKTRGNVKNTKKNKRNAFVSKLNTHMYVCPCVCVQKRKQKAKEKESKSCWFCALISFCFGLVSTATAAAPLVIIIFSPSQKGGKDQGERSGSQKGRKKIIKKRKCKSKSIYYAAMAWRGLQEAWNTSESESTNCTKALGEKGLSFGNTSTNFMINYIYLI